MAVPPALTPHTSSPAPGVVYKWRDSECQAHPANLPHLPSERRRPRRQISDQKRVVGAEEVNAMKIRTSVKAGAIVWGT